MQALVPTVDPLVIPPTTSHPSCRSGSSPDRPLKYSHEEGTPEKFRAYIMRMHGGVVGGGWGAECKANRSPLASLSTETLAFLNPEERLLLGLKDPLVITQHFYFHPTRACIHRDVRSAYAPKEEGGRLQNNHGRGISKSFLERTSFPSVVELRDEELEQLREGGLSWIGEILGRV
ncbi:hypothetical protein KFL_014210010 [Klebsormidium nitens]|uniref:Uncharacterized protein n=1 Tax=Klebsormidium nitens TaxID=105231 RepID=A0A1Y1IR08_KLENI|nr:hypothetical protein KFL_014210010 [Klebsormidium nitens]|eukprot:GAQ93290.1 hypothetical protein KFL_014210010 [Klebsormidium nitens]